MAHGEQHAHGADREASDAAGSRILGGPAEDLLERAEGVLTSPGTCASYYGPFQMLCGLGFDIGGEFV
jgi:hypothetical protein